MMKYSWKNILFAMALHMQFEFVYSRGRDRARAWRDDTDFVETLRTYAEGGRFFLPAIS